MNKPVRITVAVPAEMVRRGVCAILRSLSVLTVEVFEVSELDQLRPSLAWQHPDVLVVEPASLGMSVLSQIRKEAPVGMKFVALPVALIDPAVLHWFDETLSLYDTVDQIDDKLTRLVRQTGADRRHEALSQREKEIIACVVRGMTNKQIAERLCLSTHTVITHRRNISAKLDIHSTAGLTIYAIVNKLVELSEIGKG